MKIRVILFPIQFFNEPGYAHLPFEFFPEKHQAGLWVFFQLKALVTPVVRKKKTKPFRSKSFNNTTRAEGMPSLEAVASVMAFGSMMAVSSACCHHLPNCSTGSSATSVSDRTWEEYSWRSAAMEAFIKKNCSAKVAGDLQKGVGKAGGRSFG